MCNNWTFFLFIFSSIKLKRLFTSSSPVRMWRNFFSLFIRDQHKTESLAIVLSFSLAVKSPTGSLSLFFHQTIARETHVDVLLSFRDVYFFQSLRHQIHCHSDKKSFIIELDNSFFSSFVIALLLTEELKCCFFVSW